MHAWLITGANGNLGRRLVQQLLAGDPSDQVTAVVRSTRAQAAVAEIDLSESQRQRLRIEVLDYNDVERLRQVTVGCDRVVHLVGIIKETKRATYEDAHEVSTGCLVEALGVAVGCHITYMSIVGSAPNAPNACLASKGRAEEVLGDCRIGCCVLRVPMVLGEHDYASSALHTRAMKSSSFAFRAASLEQPIYAGDVVQAIMQAGRLAVHASLDLGGPEVLSRGDLTHRAAAVLGNQTKVRSLPTGVGLLMAKLLGLLPNPPITAAMLEVLDHDDNVDPAAALEALGMADLTGLDDMLRAVLIS